MLGQILNQTDKIVGHEQQSEDLYRNLSLRLKYQVEVLQEEIQRLREEKNNVVSPPELLQDYHESVTVYRKMVVGLENRVRQLLDVQERLVEGLEDTMEREENYKERMRNLQKQNKMLRDKLEIKSELSVGSSSPHGILKQLEFN